jgi:hypothetical protein
MQILTDQEKILLERYLKKRNDDFMNLCEARDRIIAMKKYHENKKDALISKLERYNMQIQVLSDEVIEKKLLL